MKLAEIQAGKNYLVYSREDWLDATWEKSYPRAAEKLNRYRWTPVTDESGNIKRDYKGRVMMTNKSGSVDWVVLKQIRAEWAEGVALIANTNRAKRSKFNDAGIRYAEHLRRKAEHERKKFEEPIRKEFFEQMKSLPSGQNIWVDTPLRNLPIEVMISISTALKAMRS